MNTKYAYSVNDMVSLFAYGFTSDLRIVFKYDRNVHVDNNQETKGKVKEHVCCTKSILSTCSFEPDIFIGFFAIFGIFPRNRLKCI